MVVFAITTAYMVFIETHWYVWRVFKDDNSTAEELNARPQKNNITNSSALNARGTGPIGYNDNGQIQTGSHLSLNKIFTEHSDKELKPTVDMPAEYFSKYFPKFKTERMMIYSCASSRSLCGGWGDRIRGLYSVYMLSILQKRTFGIEITKPCTIEEVYRPNMLDWRVPLNAFYGKQVGRTVYLDKRAPPHTVEDILARVPDNDTVRVTFNQDYIDTFRYHKSGYEAFAFLKHLAYSDIRKIIYYGLFKHTDPFTEELNQFFDEKVGDHKLISVHIRIGDPGGRVRYREEDLDIIWDFLLQYRNKSNYKIFVASDRQYLKDHARNLFGDQFVGFNEEIIHTDHIRYRNETACRGHRFSLLEFAILARSDASLLTRSGFGIEAAYLRPTPDNLYCYIQNRGIIPCTPVSLKSLYGR